MSKKSVFAIANTRSQAESIVTELKDAGFSNNDISVLFPDEGTTRDFAHESHTKAPEGAVTGATTGGVIGGALGWIAGIGAAVGGIAGALIGMGIPELEAKRYEGKIRRGNLLISVHTENSEGVERAKKIFRQAGADDITTASESATPRSSERSSSETTSSGRRH